MADNGKKRTLVRDVLRLCYELVTPHPSAGQARRKGNEMNKQLRLMSVVLCVAAMVSGAGCGPKRVAITCAGSTAFRVWTHHHCGSSCCLLFVSIIPL
jgi:hypothetical protein